MLYTSILLLLFHFSAVQKVIFNLHHNFGYQSSSQLMQFNRNAETPCRETPPPLYCIDQSDISHRLFEST